MQLDAFTAAYIVAALWSSTDNSTPSGGEPLDANYATTDIAPEALDRIKADCGLFQQAHAELLAQAYALYSVTDGSSSETYAGHDFWLTRNSHGAGFWDRDLGEVGEQLTAAAHAAGGCDIYVGDDRRLYV
jgi:hypothetical protein